MSKKLVDLDKADAFTDGDGDLWIKHGPKHWHIEGISDTLCTQRHPGGWSKKRIIATYGKH